MATSTTNMTRKPTTTKPAAPKLPMVFAVELGTSRYGTPCPSITIVNGPSSARDDWRKGRALVYRVAALLEEASGLNRWLVVPCTDANGCYLELNTGDANEVAAAMRMLQHVAASAEAKRVLA